MLSRKLIEKTDNLLKKEKGTVFKDPGGKLNICLVYPNTYFVGMSNLGFQGIYTLLNERNDVVCERAFLPASEDMDEFRRTKTEIFSLESKRPIGRFDIIAFSVSFENDYLNILKILELSNIPLRAKQRKPFHPLLIIGGICAFSNPEPLAEFFDLCFIGEGEEMLNEFLNIYKKSAKRDEIYKNSLSIEGIYVPGFYKLDYEPSLRRTALNNAPLKIKRRFIKDISKVRLRPSIITPKTEFSSMYLIEAMRGCSYKCDFCLTGHIYNPLRIKPLSVIKEEIALALRHTERIGLIAPSLTDYPYIEDVLMIKGVNFGITSLRASPKSAHLLGLLKGHKSVSIAPEAGTERIRRVINKRVTEEDIIETSRLIFKYEIEKLRLYFMIGLPTETYNDIEGIINLVKKIRDTLAKGEIVLTISTFVPKPFTPFQWHPMESPDRVKQRLSMIKKTLIPIKGIKVFHDLPKYAYMQGIFSMGDRRLSNALEEMLKIEDWQKAVINSKLDPDFYIFRKRDFNEPLPWDFIDSGVKKEALWREYQRALNHCKDT